MGGAQRGEVVEGDDPVAVGLTVGAWLNWKFVAPRLRSYTELASDSITIPSFLGARRDPREVYDWAVQKLLELDAEQRAVAEQIKPGATVQEAMAALKEEDFGVPLQFQNFRD